MHISILTSDPAHDVVAELRSWMSRMAALGHAVHLAFDKTQLPGGDMLFLVSCHHIVRAAERARYRAALVLHASDLPHGRGWSPHIWAILGGANRIVVSLLEAGEPLDSGPVWFKSGFELQGHELLAEINATLFAVELELMTRAVTRFASVTPLPQPDGAAQPPLRRRTPADSELDPHKSIAEQFELLRVVDPDRFPAFFHLRGHRYLIKIEKAGNA